MLVAGAGPAGLTAAATLARHGVADAASWSAARPSGLPAGDRGQHAHHGAPALAWGSRRRCRPAASTSSGSVDLRDAGLGRPRASRVPLGLPDAGSRARSSARPRRPACPRTTSSGCCCATSAPRPSASVEHGRRGRRCSTTGRTASVPAPRPRERRPPGCCARYLIAADGAHSTVRAALGIPMRGPADLATGGHGPVPRAPLGPRRPAPLRHLRHRPRRRRRHAAAGRPGRPVALSAPVGGPERERPRRDGGAAMVRRIRLATGVAGLRAADRAGRHVRLRRPGRRALPRRAAPSWWATPPTG